MKTDSSKIFDSPDCAEDPFESEYSDEDSLTTNEPLSKRIVPPRIANTTSKATPRHLTTRDLHAGNNGAMSANTGNYSPSLRVCNQGSEGSYGG